MTVEPKRNPRGQFLSTRRTPWKGEPFYFLGADPAPAQGARSDDGALAALKATPKTEAPTQTESDWLLEYVWAYRLRGAGVREWSGFIHQKHEHFGFTKILMDFGAAGLGSAIAIELAKYQQLIGGVERKMTPICLPEDTTVPTAQFILHAFNRRSDLGIRELWPTVAHETNLTDHMHVQFQQATHYQLVAFPPWWSALTSEQRARYNEEEQWALKNLEATQKQLSNIQVAMNESGTFYVNNYGARTFVAGSGKKDLAYAAIYAYIAFLIFLKMGADGFGDNDGAGLCYS